MDHRHHDEVAVFDVSELVGDDRAKLILGEGVDEAPRDHDPCVARSVAVRKCVGGKVLDDAKLGQRNAELLAGLAHPEVEISADLER